MKSFANNESGKVRFPCTSAISSIKSDTDRREHHGRTTDISNNDKSLKTCPCGNQFTPKSNNQKYCSQKCPEAKKAHRKQKTAWQKKEFALHKRAETFYCVCPKCRKEFTVKGYWSTEPRPGKWSYCKECRNIFYADGWPSGSEENYQFGKVYGHAEHRGQS